jgi:hypothetical protein
MRNVSTSLANGNFKFGLYYIFKIIPMLIGGLSIYLGYRLFILGVTGQASLSVNAKTVGGQLLNAAPGLFFALGGIAANIAAVWKGVDISFERNGPRFSEVAREVFTEDVGEKKWPGPGEQI